MGGMCTTETSEDFTMGEALSTRKIDDKFCAETPGLLKTESELLSKKGNHANEQNLVDSSSSDSSYSGSSSSGGTDMVDSSSFDSNSSGSSSSCGTDMVDSSSSDSSSSGSSSDGGTDTDVGDLCSISDMETLHVLPNVWKLSSTSKPGSITYNFCSNTDAKNGLYIRPGANQSVDPRIHSFHCAPPISGTLTTSFGGCSGSDSNAYVKLSRNGVEVHRVTGPGIEEHTMQVVANDLLLFSKHGDTNMDIQSVNVTTSVQNLAMALYIKSNLTDPEKFPLENFVPIAQTRAGH